MHRWRHVLVLLATATAFAVSFAMLRRALGANSAWLGLAPMFFVLGLAKIAEPLFMLRVPGPLRAIRAREGKSGAYERLGVAAFGRLLRGTPLRYLNPALYLVRRQPDLAGTCRLVEAAEADHFWAAVLFTPWIAWVAWHGQVREGLVLLLVQLFVNVYPILHLRSVRGRLERCMRRQRPQQGG